MSIYTYIYMLYHKKYLYILYDYSIINEEQENSPYIKQKRTKILEDKIRMPKKFPKFNVLQKVYDRSMYTNFKI